MARQKTDYPITCNSFYNDVVKGLIITQADQFARIAKELKLAA